MTLLAGRPDLRHEQIFLGIMGQKRGMNCLTVRLEGEKGREKGP